MKARPAAIATATIAVCSTALGGCIEWVDNPAFDSSPAGTSSMSSGPLDGYGASLDSSSGSSADTADTADESTSSSGGSVEVDLDLGLVGYWPFDEADGSTAFDASPTGADGTIMGDPAWISGPVNGALSLDATGVIDHVALAPEPPLVDVVAGPWSVSVWLRMDDPNNSLDAWHILGLVGTETGLSFGYGQLKASVMTDGGNNFAMGEPIPIGQWFHFVVIVRPDDGLDAFVDGEQSDISPHDGMEPHLGSQWLVGRIMTDGPSSATFDIDELRVYERALQEAEVQALFEQGQL